MQTTAKAGELRTHSSVGDLKVLHFHTLQSFQTKSDSLSGRTLFIGLFDAKDVIAVDNSDNVRGYLSLNKDGDEKVSSGVHAQIYQTLINRPEDFHLLNGGITICAEAIEARDNERKRISLKNASIINGAQTRGVIKAFLRENPDVTGLLVKVELIIAAEGKGDLFDDISIARNHQNQVKAISIAGKRSLLDDLDEATETELKKNESQKDKFDTEKLVQLIFAVMPPEIWQKVFPKRNHWDKSYVYSSKASMFKKFVAIAQAKNSDEYRFFIDIANDVLRTYFYLQSNKPSLTKYMDVGEFARNGYRINSTTKELTILDGFLFPMMSLISQFIVENDGKYQLDILSDDVYRSLAKLIVEYSDVIEHGNVQTLGKKSVSYKAPYDFAKTKIILGELEGYHREK